MKITLLGHTGKVGEAVKLVLEREIYNLELQIISRSHLSNFDDGSFISEDDNQNLITYEEFDINNPQKLRSDILSFFPDVIINCIAYTNVDGCEIEKKLSWELNTVLVENLTLISKLTDAQLITFSTDYIFNGKTGLYVEDDSPDPLNYYGKSKLAAENYLKSSYDNYIIFRTSIVFGNSSFGKNGFINWIIQNLSENKPIKIVDSLWGNPTLNYDIAEAILQAILRKKQGIYNISGSSYLSRYQMATEIAELYEFDKTLIQKVELSELKQKAIRPVKAGLINLKAKVELEVHLSSLKSALLGFKVSGEILNKV